MHKPHVVQIAAYYPPHLGGLERVVEEIAIQMAHDGYKVSVLTSAIGQNDGPPREKIPNLDLVRLRGIEFAHTPFLPGLFWKLLRIPKPTIFHLHLAQAFLPEVTWAAAKIRRIPYVVHFHLDVAPSGPFGFLFVLYKKTVQKMVLRGANTVVALSAEQKELVQKVYGKAPEQVIFMPNGVSNEFLRIGKQPRKPHQPLRLLFVGRLAVQKRVDRLLDAMALVTQNVQLDIVGDGEDRAALQAQATKLKLKNTTFHGAQFGQDLKNSYQNADVFILPSDREGMPLVMLEAMATGLPVIGSDVQGIREHLEGVGILVANPSAQNFAREINDFAKSSTDTYLEFARKSHAKAQEYGWPGLTKQLEELYGKLLR